MRSRQRRLLLVGLSTALVLIFLLARFVLSFRTHQAELPRVSEQRSEHRARRIAATSAPNVPGTTLQIDHDSRTFARRLRCANYRMVLGQLASSETLALLCDRRSLEALQILIPLAQEGDDHARIALAIIGHIGGSCDSLEPSATFANYRSTITNRARRNGATSQTLQRLDDALTEQQEGPTEDEMAACQQSAREFLELMPGILSQFVGVLGRSVQALRGESEADVQIEYDRKMLVPGAADGQLRLATDLMQKGTPESQAEAFTLLREAANTIPSAKTQLAICMLKGCPTPATDPTEARAWLTDAATSGDRAALLILAGPSDPRSFNLDPSLPSPVRYAWGQFLQQLNEAGCFGTSEYISWAAFANGSRALPAMSPEDSSTANTLTANLLGVPLNRAKRLLACD